MQRVNHERRRLLAAMLVGGTALCLLPACSTTLPRECQPWGDWQDFVATHVQADGRVVDHAEADARSTSEGQAYAMFFALVANDRARFDKLFEWSWNNLGGGGDDWLPAWRWGRDADGGWRITDPNTASDADLWMAYSLIEASRLWNVPDYLRVGLDLLKAVEKRETAELAGLGPMLLPGETGFVKADITTLNPSYLPLPLLRRFALVDPVGPWRVMAEASLGLIERSSPHGYAPDWIGWDGKQVVTAPGRSRLGSYDAIRVYTWAGMTDPADPMFKRGLAATSGPLTLLRTQGVFAEKIDTASGEVSGRPPVGFSAALLPYLKAQGEASLLKEQQDKLPEPGSEAAGKLPYYEKTLILFGRSWVEGRWRFAVDGQLYPAWEEKCSKAN
ncbi:MAG: cellulose synthase complex periplasmic endoglucanase BcsZ [Pseudomonadota bacterium]|nr:cellulose synthase complex periplasmic endoglucanase BcsZ [Pseudomonadota bacterium]